MPLLIIPNVFINGTIADADLVNQNYNAIVNVINALDYQNVGALGFYASQLRPLTEAHAQFGGSGSTGYKFVAYGADMRALVLQGNASQAVDVWRIDDAAGAAKIWVDKDYVLHAGTHVDVKTIQADSISLTGLLTCQGVLATGDLHAMKNVQADVDVKAGNDIVAGKNVGAGGNANITGITTTAQVNTPKIDMGAGGSIKFGTEGQIEQHVDALSFAGGAEWDGTRWIARGNQAVIQQASKTTEGMRFFANDNLVSGNAFTPVLSMLMNVFGLTLDQYHRIRLPLGVGNIGAFPTGFYLAWGFYYDRARGFVVEQAACSGIIIGAAPSPANQSRCWITHQTGQTIGAVFTPAFMCGIASGSTNQWITMHGVQLRSSANMTATGPSLFGGPGVPPNTLGSNGDFFFRNDSPGTMPKIYCRISGAWTVIVT